MLKAYPYIDVLSQATYFKGFQNYMGRGFACRRNTRSPDGKLDALQYRLLQRELVA